MKHLIFSGASLFEELALLFSEIFDYIKEKYFTMDLTGFENFNFQEGSLITVPMIVFGLCVGVIIACFMTVYDKKYLGAFARIMIEDQIFSPDKAKTLNELGFSKSSSVRSALKGGNFFRGWIRCVEEDEYIEEMRRKREEYEEKRKHDPSLPKFKETKFKIKPETMHFYMPEEKQYAAEVKFSSQGANYVMVLFVAVFMIALAVVFCAYLPDILHLVDNFITIFK